MNQNCKCNHDQINSLGFCLDCYEEVTNTDNYVQVSKDVFMTKSCAEQQIRATTQNLINKQKLSLLLDLDSTIIFTDQTHLYDLDEIPENVDTSPERGFFFQIPEYSKKVFVYFRDGIVAFMTKLITLYEIHVVTLGQKDYAMAIVEALNKLPGGPFINGKIVCSEDCISEILKDDGDFQNDGLIERNEDTERRAVKRTVPGMGSEEVQIVVDDRIDVWDNHNVLQIQEFVLPNSENVKDNELERISEILKYVHTEFFGGKSNVRVILSEMREHILKGKKIYFSKPKGGETKMNKMTEFIWNAIKRNCEMMGAVMQSLVRVDGENKTDLIIDAKPYNGIKAVNCGFIMMSWIMMEEMKLEKFEITDDNSQYKEITKDEIWEDRKRGDSDDGTTTNLSEYTDDSSDSSDESSEEKNTEEYKNKQKLIRACIERNKK
ncbi:RNA polymerase II ctd phosphatase, putative [Entamoeba invadens IP1]|uniref:protein-serine/threonine phosphatase n=1 Tax=Entamoeba invadens IP1 TaxID=370355 RepID=A0A0A1TYV4_ENTIV|nr:RNA polymerase II ctd phosphatase, putative [Entamoeba invadens IP1]ELP83711.1 RNA polymerase II ctd phosphatase, putative [Entamoeba invadens IP1]|eukprot:XP_004183057.1 RNA polymerase II ctd phosphatase, putative [Entamoeba invadens IP1]